MLRARARARDTLFLEYAVVWLLRSMFNAMFLQPLLSRFYSPSLSLYNLVVQLQLYIYLYIFI